MSFNRIKLIRWIYDHTPCQEDRDCAHLAYFIEEQLQKIKGIRFDSIRIQDCPALLRNHDILVVTLPTLFSHFHYLTIVYENEKIYIFQNYGRYEIPILVKTMRFFSMVKNYLAILLNPKSDQDMLRLVQYESNMYGLSTDQMDELLIKKEIRNALRTVNTSISNHEKKEIMSRMESIPEWTDINLILSSFLSTSSSIFSWMKTYSYHISVKLKLNPNQEEFVMEKLLLFIRDMYQDESYRNLFIIRQAKFFYSEMDPRERKSSIIHRYQLPLRTKRLSYRRKK